VNISCLSSVTCKSPSTFDDIIICKWESNGVDHYDTNQAASNSCTTFGYMKGLFSTDLISNCQTTPTNDQTMVKQYIGSSVCLR
jgi:hypothetical protein